MYKRFQVHFLCAQDLNDCLTALERMGIVVKHSDTRYTLKASNQSIEQEFEPVTEPPFLPSQSSKPREILAKRRVQGKAEYLIAVGESREWVVYSSEWPIADQQLALEYEKLSSSQLIENYTNLKDSSDNVSTPQISSPVLDTSAAPKGLIIGDTAGINSQGNTLHLSDQINLDKEKATETAFVDLDSVNLMQFEPSADRKKFILAHLQSNSERYLSQLSKILGSN